MRCSTSARNSGWSSRSAVPGVRMKVGATQLTVTPYGPHSSASTFVRPITAALLEVYAAWRRMPTRPACELIQPAEALHRGRHGRLDGAPVAQVHLDRRRLTALGGDLRAEALQQPDLARRNGNARPGVGEGEREVVADALAGAGDQRHLPVE